MKFREEVFAKVFTYITVIALLGIIVVEAWKLQEERENLARAQEDIEAAASEIEYLYQEKETLESENEELSRFQRQWSPYAAYLESSQVEDLQLDLFSRPDLIPKAVCSALEEQALVRLEEQDEEIPEKIKADLTFDNPEGENIFLPLNTGNVNEETCLIYTAAYWEEQDMAAELIFEIDLTDLKEVAERDENGELIWTCVSYNTGKGWVGVRMEEDLE